MSQPASYFRGLVGTIRFSTPLGLRPECHANPNAKDNRALLNEEELREALLEEAPAESAVELWAQDEARLGFKPVIRGEGAPVKARSPAGPS